VLLARVSQRELILRSWMVGGRRTALRIAALTVIFRYVMMPANATSG
jgi:hypothetical protein